MFKPLSLFIGLRYTRAKRRNHFISFISLMSMLGIALGVAVLITVLSVMNGFDKQIGEQIFSMAPQVTISNPPEGIRDWQGLEKTVQTIAVQHDLEKIQGVAPYVNGQALLMAGGNQTQAMVVTGISREAESQVSGLSGMVEEGSFQALAPGKFGILIGQSLAVNFGLSVGDSVNVLIPSASLTPLGVFPRFTRFTVVGIFKVGNGFNFDDQLSFINIKDAQALFGLGNNVTGIRLKITHGLDAPIFARELMQYLPISTNNIGTWADTYGPLFHAIALEKNMMFLILLLIIMVAVFNLVSSLVMVVNEKQADIAILRTLGMRSKTVMRIFVIQGALIGFIGTGLGLAGGLLLSFHVTAIVNWIQAVTGLQLISSSVYFIDYLPCDVQSFDVIRIVAFSLSFSLLATLYPAWRAARTEPVEALRYE